jgi:hypothetical protein
VGFPQLKVTLAVTAMEQTVDLAEAVVLAQ